MNHYISGILKIILIEGSIALLLLDAVAKDRFARARSRAHALLAGLMVFAWCNYGSLRHNIDVLTALTSVPLILFSGFIIGLAFDSRRQERIAALIGWAKGRRGRLSSWLVAAAPSMGAQAKPLAVGLVVLLSGAWVGGGVASGRLPLVHPWEQFHFYLGAKYQRQVGWFNLYKAAILADRETVGVLGSMPTTRDLRTFDQVPLDVALRDAHEVRSRFSDEQWKAFKSDWTTMVGLWPMSWTAVLNDHGNSNSPAWAVVAAPIATLVPLSGPGQALLGWLDMLLMLGLWLAVWQSFGHRAASVGLFVWAMPPIVFDYLSGSFLRWDWLFALGVAACFLKQKRYAWAGGFFGFALATKLFPIFFGVALGLKALWQWRQTKTFKREYLRFGAGATAVGALAVASSTLMFGPDAWREYAQRIEVANLEKFYAIQYSFRTVYLQHAAQPLAAWAQAFLPSDLAQRREGVELCRSSSQTSTATACSRELAGCGDGRRYSLHCLSDGQCACSKDGATGRTFTRELPCAQSNQERTRLFEEECGYPKDYSLGFLLARVLFSLFIVALILRAEDVEAFLLGPLLVFTWITVNMYYWNMLGLMALGLTLRSERAGQRPAFVMLLGLQTTFIVFYVCQHLNRGVAEAYPVAWLLTALVLAVGLWEGLKMIVDSRRRLNPTGAVAPASGRAQPPASSSSGNSRMRVASESPGLTTLSSKPPSAC